MFDIKPQSLQYWYKNFLSDYMPDIENKKWHPQKIETVDEFTGEVLKEKPVYIFKPENLGQNMAIDDKNIGGNGFTIFSNNDTGKIAMMIESTRYEEISVAMGLFGDELRKVRNVSRDMSTTYALTCSNFMPLAIQVIDKFHVMRYVYDAVSQVRINICKELKSKLSEGKKKTEEDKRILAELEPLRRVIHALTQSPEKWSEEMKNTINQLFEKYDTLKIAYQISQSFKHWYNFKNHLKPIAEISTNLNRWYEQAKQIEEFKSVIRMIRKHEDEILNFFRHGMTNAKAERLNGKIQRFVSNNYGIKDKDFILYRIANYFS